MASPLIELPGDSLFLQTTNNAIPMRMYRVVQMGPNAQLGGVKEGLTKVGNQSKTPCDVKNEPTAPAAKGIDTAMINLYASLFPSGANDLSKIIFHLSYY